MQEKLRIIGYLAGSADELPSAITAIVVWTDTTLHGVWCRPGEHQQIINEKGDPLTEAELYNQKDLVWFPHNAPSLCFKEGEIAFAFGRKDIFIGTWPKVFEEIKRRLSGQLEKQYRKRLIEARDDAHNSLEADVRKEALAVNQ